MKTLSILIVLSICCIVSGSFAQNVGIGTATPGAKLEVVGTFKVTDGTQGANKILTSDPSGLASWQESELSELASAPCASVDAYFLSGVTTGSYPRSVAVSGNYAYLVNLLSNSLQIFNVSNPFSPYLVGSAATGSDPRSIVVSGDYAYVVNSAGIHSLQIFDVSTPSNPLLVGSAVTGDSPRTVAVSGDYAYVVNFNSNSLQIFDVSTPSSPLLVGSAVTGSYPISVALSGDYAYVVNIESNSLQIFNVSTPSSPFLAGSAGTGSYPISVAFSGDHAYVVNYSSNSLQIFDVSTPSSPCLVGSAGTGNGPSTVAISGDYAYVVNLFSNSLQIYNFSCMSLIILDNGNVVSAPMTWIDINADIFNVNPGNVGIGTTSPLAKLHVFGGNIRTNQQLVSTVGTGTAPIIVSSTTSVSNLNADLLDGKHADGFIKNQTTSDQAAGFQINGNGIFNGGKIGIGTTSPTGDLQIESTGDVTIVLNADTDNAGGEEDNPRIEMRQDGGGVVGALGLAGSANVIHTGDLVNALYLVHEWDNALQFGTNNEIKMTILPTGNVGVGTNNPGAKLDVIGSVRAKFSLILQSNNASPTIAGMKHEGNNLLYVYNDDAGNTGVYLAEGGTSWLAFSDARLKRDVEPLGNILDKVCQLNAKRFHMITDPDTMTKRMGFIAQDVQRLFPDIVNAESGFLALSYSDFGILSIEAIKELRAEKDAEINALNRKIDILSIQNQELKARIEEIRQYLEMKAEK